MKAYTCDQCREAIDYHNQYLRLMRPTLSNDQQLRPFENEFCSYECMTKWLSDYGNRALQWLDGQHHDLNGKPIADVNQPA